MSKYGETASKETRCELCGNTIFPRDIDSVVVRWGPVKPNGAVLDTGYAHRKCSERLGMDQGASPGDLDKGRRRPIFP